jgi:hypothetical protein
VATDDFDDVGIFMIDAPPLHNIGKAPEYLKPVSHFRLVAALQNPGVMSRPPGCRKGPGDDFVMNSPNRSK